ncbi:hypothetical protein GGG16DRAFT_89779, partial [Schizophyllum commune]
MLLAVPVADCDPVQTSPNARTGCASRNWGRSVCTSAQIAGAASEGLRRRGGHDPSGSTQAVLGTMCFTCRRSSTSARRVQCSFRTNNDLTQARPLATNPTPIQSRVAAQLRKSKTTLDSHNMNTHLPHSWPSNSRIPRTSALSSSSPSSNSAHHKPALRRLRVLPERRQRREVDRPLAQLDSLALVCIAHDLLRITRVQRRDERRVCQ